MEAPRLPPPRAESPIRDQLLALVAWSSSRFSPLVSCVRSCACSQCFRRASNTNHFASDSSSCRPRRTSLLITTYLSASFGCCRISALALSAPRAVLSRQTCHQACQTQESRSSPGRLDLVFDSFATASARFATPLKACELRLRRLEKSSDPLPGQAHSCVRCRQPSEFGFPVRPVSPLPESKESRRCKRAASPAGFRDRLHPWYTLANRTERKLLRALDLLLKYHGSTASKPALPRHARSRLPAVSSLWQRRLPAPIGGAVG